MNFARELALEVQERCFYGDMYNSLLTLAQVTLEVYGESGARESRAGGTSSGDDGHGDLTFDGVSGRFTSITFSRASWICNHLLLPQQLVIIKVSPKPVSSCTTSEANIFSSNISEDDYKVNAECRQVCCSNINLIPTLLYFLHLICSTDIESTAPSTPAVHQTVRETLRQVCVQQQDEIDAVRETALALRGGLRQDLHVVTIQQVHEANAVQYPGAHVGEERVKYSMETPTL